jgi:hypothetical protein
MIDHIETENAHSVPAQRFARILRRLHAIPRDNLLGRIDEGAQARAAVT